MGYMCLFQFWFPQRICLGVGLLGHMVALFLVFKGLSIPSSIVAVSVYIPTSNARIFPFYPHPLQHSSDDHYIYYCGQESLRRNAVAIIVNRRL